MVFEGVLARRSAPDKGSERGGLKRSSWERSEVIKENNQEEVIVWG